MSTNRANLEVLKQGIIDEAVDDRKTKLEVALVDGSITTQQKKDEERKRVNESCPLVSA